MSHFRQNSQVWYCVCGGAAIAALATFALTQVWRPSLLDTPKPRASHSSVHVLLVTLTFKSAEEREEWAAWWKGLAERVYANEPNCLSYEMSVDNDDPTKIIIFERYVSKADLDGIHQQSIASHVALSQKLGVTPISKELRHFTESNLGHMDR